MQTEGHAWKTTPTPADKTGQKLIISHGLRVDVHILLECVGEITYGVSSCSRFESNHYNIGFSL